MRRPAKALGTALLAALALAAIGASPASAAFGLKNLDITFAGPDGSAAMQAGSHPFAMVTNLDLNTRIDPIHGEIPDDAVKDLTIALAAGQVGEAAAVPRCPAATFLKQSEGTGTITCPDDSVVGFIELTLGNDSGIETSMTPIYDLPAPPGSVIELGFIALKVPVTFQIGLSPTPPYNGVATFTGVSQVLNFYGSKATIWGVPASHAHDAQRGKCLTSPAEDLCPVGGAAEKPFLTLPTSCAGPLHFGFDALSWQNPGAAPLHYEIETHDNSAPPAPLGTTGCAKLGFGPTLTAQPTTRAAESPSGLDVSLDVDDEGLTNPTGLAQSALKEAVVTLPAGMTVNPSSASGLGACSQAQLAHETLASAPGEGCPDASKLGTIEVRSPLVEEALQGSLFLAGPYENPFGSLIALYMVIENQNLGIILKLPVKVEPDPLTGRLIATSPNLPQLPFSSFKLHFREGARSPLVSPPACGTYQTQARLIPSSGGPAITSTSSFQIISGSGESPCPPAGVPPFKPGFEAGSINNAAGSYSPFYLRLTRHDGEQDMTRFDSVLPPGVTGKIAGIPRCPDAAIAAAKAKSGAQELAEPSCPAASQIGRTLAGAGVGSVLTYVPGKLYLGGPFAGDPLSIVAITPALAGPFDAGTVVVREALTLDPSSAEVQVDGAASDPLPHILKGIPLKLRDLRVYVDRENFTLNATNCRPLEAKATIFGSFLDVFSPADDVPVGLSARYQAADCAALGFAPKLSLKLKGGTKRSGHPALHSVLTYPKGGRYANVAKAVVTLPPSEFIDNAHISNPCTRVQFAAEACPKGSILGTARAITPLLDEPLEGPVYFRSNGGERPLPDVVADLHGLFEIVLVGKVDTATPKTNPRIRTTFAQVPDAPVSKFTLTLNGGKKGLLVNNRNLCAHKLHATIDLSAQNGRGLHSRPLVGTSCGR